MEMHNSHSGNSHLSNDLIYQDQHSTLAKGANENTFDSADIDSLMTLFMNNPSTRQLAKKVVQYNGAAVLGALAYKAHANWQSNKSLDDITAVNGHDVCQASPLPNFTHAQNSSDESLLVVSLMKAMIATASKSPEYAGDIEDLLTAASYLGFTDTKIAFIKALLHSAITPHDIARHVNLDKEKSEIYVAAYVASNGDGTLESAFLSDLALALELPEGMTTYLECQSNLGIAP